MTSPSLLLLLPCPAQDLQELLQAWVLHRPQLLPGRPALSSGMGSPQLSSLRSCFCVGSSLDCSVSSFSVVSSTDCRKLPALVLGEPPPVPSSFPLVFTGLLFTLICHTDSTVQLCPLLHWFQRGTTSFSNGCAVPCSGTSQVQAAPGPIIKTLPVNTIEEHFL